MQPSDAPPPRGKAGRKTIASPARTAAQTAGGTEPPPTLDTLQSGRTTAAPAHAPDQAPDEAPDRQPAPEPDQPFHRGETRLHLDAPAASDGLGRAPLAAAMGKRLQRLWARANDGGGGDNSLVVHVHGAWGAGKSTFLRFLRRQLTVKADPALSDRFVVIEFNAWQYQRADPPWWFLLDAVYRQGRRSLPWWRRLWFVARENGWRLGCGNGLALTTFLVAAAITALLLAHLNGLFGGGAADSAFGLMTLWTSGESANIARTVTAVVSLVVTLAAGIKFGLSSLFTGSARAAERMFQHLDDPAERFRTHFRWMLERLDRPVAVFIDDLDRCSSDYTVRLIEGIQTLFNDSRVVYVIAADRRWLECCFMCQYSQFKGHVEQPGFSLGHLFVQKLVQLFVALPRPTPQQQRTYWQHLLMPPQSAETGGAAAQEDRADRAEVESRADALLGDRTSEEDIMQAVRLSREEGADVGGAVARKAVERLADAHGDQDVQHFLMPLAPLLDPNPRSMKRLVNSYTIFRDVALLSGLPIEDSDARRLELARWAILAMDAPLLLDHLEDSEDRFDRFVDWDGPDQGIPPDIASLRTEDRFRRLFAKDDGAPAITYDLIHEFALLRG